MDCLCFFSYSRSTRAGRFSTKHQEFVDKYNLGVPEYGNFFVAQYDEYVPILNDLLNSYESIDISE